MQQLKWIILNLSFLLFTITVCCIVYFMPYFICVLYNSLLNILWILDFKLNKYYYYINVSHSLPLIFDRRIQLEYRRVIH